MIFPLLASSVPVVKARVTGTVVLAAKRSPPATVKTTADARAAADVIRIGEGAADVE